MLFQDKVVKPDWDYRLSPDYQLFLSQQSQQHKQQMDQMCQVRFEQQTASPKVIISF